ncbi:MAG TPA: hypothetical protein VF624_03105 [Tepidisphaeraceae bacterium]|jgi:hypothetical protein
MGSVVLKGLLAGAAGVAAMTLAEKIEQSFTQRPNSYVPAHTLERLAGLEHKPDAQRLALNHTMHWGQGILLGVVRAFMARSGWQGAVPSFIFTALRLTSDQVLENATGVGAPPWTWPKDEQRIDVIHKSVYGFVTGFVADQLFADRARRRDRHWYVRR